jgi:hypothetical protein
VRGLVEAVGNSITCLCLRYCKLRRNRKQITSSAVIVELLGQSTKTSPLFVLTIIMRFDRKQKENHVCAAIVELLGQSTKTSWSSRS